MNNIVISLDGHSGCGKSTLAKLIAQSLKFMYIDTGAMYRAITLYFIKNKLIDYNNKLTTGYSDFLDKAIIDFSTVDENGKCWVRLNGLIVEKEIRSLEVSNMVSYVSQSSLVREKMVQLQKSYGETENLVMDGRDIGSVVFPNAQIKFWVTASVEKRAERRYLEFMLKGTDTSLEEVRENIVLRDKQDENRTISPLVKPENAIIIDNTALDVNQTFDKAIKYINEYKYSQ
jgi:cytidylate kinase